jgi:hypothetical protein
VRFGCQRLLVEIVVEIAVPELGSGGCVLSFENRGGQIEVGITPARWLDRLTDDQRAAFFAAVRGLADMSAAQRFEGHPRDPEQPAGKEAGPADLARPFTFPEWVQTWEPAR